MILAPVLLTTSLAVPAFGCVVPPPLEVELGADAGANTPPIFIEARDSALNPVHPPASFTVDRGVPGEIGVTLLDRDSDDTMIVRMFVDYDPANALGPRAECVAPPAADDSDTRATTCATGALCTQLDVRPEPHRLEMEVYDRELEDLDTTFRRVKDPGLSSIWTFDLFCTDNP